MGEQPITSDSRSSPKMKPCPGNLLGHRVRRRFMRYLCRLDEGFVDTHGLSEAEPLGDLVKRGLDVVHFDRQRLRLDNSVH